MKILDLSGRPSNKVNSSACLFWANGRGESSTTATNPPRLAALFVHTGHPRSRWHGNRPVVSSNTLSGSRHGGATLRASAFCEDSNPGSKRLAGGRDTTNTKPYVAVCVRRIVPVSVSRAAVPGIVVPRAATNNPIRALRPIPLRRTHPTAFPGEVPRYWHVLRVPPNS